MIIIRIINIYISPDLLTLYKTFHIFLFNYSSPLNNLSSGSYEWLGHMIHKDSTKTLKKSLMSHEYRINVQFGYTKNMIFLQKMTAIAIPFLIRMKKTHLSSHPSECQANTRHPKGD